MSAAGVSGLVLAAGSSRRAGGAKALARLDGVPFVARTVATLREGGCDQVIVVTHASIFDPLKALNLPAILVDNPQPERGMLSSVQCGLASTGASAVVIALVDHPRVAASTVATLIDALATQDAVVLRPKFGAETGHPVLVRGPVLDAIRNTDASQSLRDVLARFSLKDVDVADPGILDDWDTRAEIEAGGGTLT